MLHISIRCHVLVPNRHRPNLDRERDRNIVSYFHILFFHRISISIIYQSYIYSVPCIGTFNNEEHRLDGNLTETVNVIISPICLFTQIVANGLLCMHVLSS